MPERPRAAAPADVAIIGGGPAGSTAAALLAAAGRKVLLFEKERFPRFHIGESLLPCNNRLFRRLGVEDRLEAEAVKKWGANLVSSDGTVRRIVRFREGMVPGLPSAYHVLRSRFDQILLENAAARGAEIHEGTAVVEARPSAREGCSLTVRDPGGGLQSHRARFLLDASGRDAFLAARRGLRRMAPAHRKAAVYAHFQGVAREAGDSAGDIVLVVLRNGWFWFIPVSEDITSVGLVLDGPSLGAERMAPAEMLEAALRRCPAARERAGGARRVTDAWTVSDYSYRCREMAGDGYLLLGDAAAFIDPVFSTGVWLAMSSAEMASDALHRALGPDGSAGGIPTRRFASYERRLRRHLRSYARLVRSFYRPGFMDLFLSPDTPLRIKEAVITLLAGVADPPLSVRWRLALFYLALGVQPLFPLAKPVPLQGVLEESGS